MEGSASSSLATRTWATPASEESIARTVAALAANGIQTWVVDSTAEAAAKTLELVPPGSEVMTATSITLDETGIARELNESGSFDAVKPRLSAMDRETDERAMRKLGASPD
ncbi:MAG TPA: LUD domain-containing protein, partial [Rectinemataceae bacterium]|nr:LUD domain-containing protein [Rectinemataceae bacterium]